MTPLEIRRRIAQQAKPRGCIAIPQDYSPIILADQGLATVGGYSRLELARKTLNAARDGAKIKPAAISDALRATGDIPSEFWRY